MKKASLIIISAILTVVCLLALTGCDELSGASAYEVAVQNGYVGTEAQWLDSLKQGSSAYDIAVANGFTGTEEEWIAGLQGTDGTNGIDGQDGNDTLSIEEIYAAAQTNGYAGTFLEFLQEYLNVDIGSADTQYAVSKAMRSSVSIYCSFTKIVTTFDRYGRPITADTDYASAGSGVIYKMDADGNAYVITNYHVVYDVNSNQTNHISNDINVFLYGQEYSDMKIAATYVGGSMTYDIAILRISDSEILKSSDAVATTIYNGLYIAVGQTAIAVGNPEADGISATAGIVSVDSETITMTGADETTSIDFRVMRVDTAINSGNSGGGLFNSKGELIGIVNAKIIEENIENIGYALPVNTVKAVADNIIDNCVNTDKNKVQKCLLGITTVVNASKATYDESTGLTMVEETIKVHEVSETALAKDILQAEDILVSATLHDITYKLNRSYILVDLMVTARVNDTLTLVINRGGEILTKEIVISEGCVTEVV